MAKHSWIGELELVTIASKEDSTRATFVPDRGGTACSILMPGSEKPRELLYLHDFFWNTEISNLPGGWPFCFPICGRLQRQGQDGAYLYDGKVYHLKIHGFSWYQAWSLVNESEDSITLVLQDNQYTREQYPFSFKVELNYRVSEGQLLCEQTYWNLSDRPMPYYAGFHPYFLTPKLGEGKEKVMINYHPSRRLLYNEDLTDIRGEAALFDLPSTVTNADINEQLTLVGENKEIRITYPDGDAINMHAEGLGNPNLFSYIQLYTQPEKPFICVEPWMSFPNAMNSVYGVQWLLPGQSERGLLTLSLQRRDENS